MITTSSPVTSTETIVKNPSLRPAARKTALRLWRDVIRHLAPFRTTGP